MNRRFGHRQGFTLIELILAVAITVVLATCVYSATQAMSGTARRQGEISAKQTRRDRFEEIIRRDLRGWLPLRSSTGSTNPDAKAAPTSNENQTLLKFMTTADGLTNIQTSALPAPQRATSIEYVLRKLDNAFEVDRIEECTSRPAITIVLYQGSDEAKVEAFDGTKWLPKWSRNDRPSAVRWTLGSDVILVKL